MLNVNIYIYNIMTELVKIMCHIVLRFVTANRKCINVKCVWCWGILSNALTNWLIFIEKHYISVVGSLEVRALMPKLWCRALSGFRMLLAWNCFTHEETLMEFQAACWVSRVMVLFTLCHNNYGTYQHSKRHQISSAIVNDVIRFQTVKPLADWRNLQVHIYPQPQWWLSENP